VINFFEILALLVLITCVIFLARRNVVKVPRLNRQELSSGWPRKDGNYILLFEIVLMSLFLIMNASDKALQAKGYGHYADVETHFWISGLMTPLISKP
jgi:hypothetical protein